MTAPAVEIAPPAPNALARRPCLLPGVRAYQRAVDEVQIGVSPGRAVLLTDLPPRIVSVICALDGETPLGRLLARAGPQNVVQLCTLLRDLAAEGLVIDAGEPGPDQRLATTAIVVRGDGPLAACMAVHLAYAGVGHVVVDSAGSVEPADLGHTFGSADLGRPRRQVIDQALHATGTSVGTGPLPSDYSPDLVILTDQVVPDPEAVRRLMSERQEHLVVAVRDGNGIVGPLVLPGRSACLECFDRYRTDRDPRWPQVAGQLAGRVQRADSATTQATASLAVAQALLALQPSTDRPPLLEATIELDLQEGRTLRREWLPHPLCGCGVGERWEVRAA